MPTYNGTAGSDYLQAQDSPAVDDVLNGFGGNDTLIGGLGSDSLYGGDGNDTVAAIYGDRLVDLVDGGAGDDTLIATPAAIFDGGSGNDRAIIRGWYLPIVGGGTFSFAPAGNYTIDLRPRDVGGEGVLPFGGAIRNNVESVSLELDFGQSGALSSSYTWTVYGSNQNESIAVGAGADFVQGGGGDDIIVGNGGADILYGDGGSDTVVGGTGADTLYGGAGDDTLYAGDQSPFFDLGSSADVLYGGDGNDTLIGILGGTFYGGAGIDQLNFSVAQSSVVTIDLRTLTFAGGSYSGVINGGVISGIESFSIGSAGSGTGGQLTFYGVDQADNVNAGLGDDVLYGFGGNDVLRGGGGADTIYGGDGNDTLYGDGDYFSPTVNFLDGGAGDDLLYSGYGSTFIGGSGNDTARISVTGFVNIDLRALTFSAGSLSGTAGGGDISGIEQVYVQGFNSGALAFQGSAANDVVYGFGGDDFLYGNDGSDFLYASYGNDTIAGGAGADYLYGDNGDDFIYADLADAFVDGGDGYDTLAYDFSAGSSAVVFSLAGATPSLSVGGVAATTTFSSIDRVSITSGSGNDNLTGGIYGDYLSGGAGNDTISGGGGEDVIRGGTGSNTLYGGAGANTVDYSWTNLGVSIFYQSGSTSASSIGGGAEAFTDSLDSFRNFIGGAGADRFTVFNAPSLLSFNGAGNGAGGDTIDFRPFAGAVWVDLELAGAEVWTRDNIFDITSGTWRTILSLTDVENLIGTAGSDYLRGNGQDNVFYYGGVIIGGGHDVIDGAGNGAFGDTADFSLYDYAVWVDLGFGVGDEAWSRGQQNLLSGIWYGIADISNVERIVGTAFDDTLYGVSGTRGLSGGAGADTLVVRTTALGNIITVDGGAGTDTIDFSQFGAAVWVHLSLSGYEGWTQDRADLTGGTWREIADIAGVENIVGSTFGDNIQGDGAANRIFYTGGVDSTDGAGGTDTLDFSRFGSAVWADLGQTSQSMWTMDRADLVGGVWRVIGDVSNVENVLGTAGADDLRGNAGVNRLEGGNGNDVLTGRGGADVLDGGAGSDTASYAGSAAVSVNLTSGFVSGGDAAGDTFISIENLIGSSNADVLTGTNGNNVLDGGGSADFLVGLNGDDTYVVDHIGDVITEEVGEGTDTVRTALNAINLGAYANVENYQHVGAGNYAVTGSAGDNVLFLNNSGGIATVDGGLGSDTADFSGFGAAVWVHLTFTGYEGWTQDTYDLTHGTWRPMSDITGVENVVGSGYADNLQGDANANRFVFTGGYDVVDGAGGVDTVDYSRFSSALWIDLSLTSQTVWTRDGADVSSGTWRALNDLSNIENVVGTNGADDLRGNAGVNVLEGGAGNDRLEGRGGNDTLTGSLGADTFVYQGAGGIIATGLDVITDFVHAADLIRVESGLTALAAQAALHIDNSGTNAIVTFDNSPGFQITVLGVDLDQSDFLFA